MGDYTNLRVWRFAHEVTLDVYRITARYPPDERFGLVVQLRRAAASIAGNIAEGCGRNSPGQSRQFFRVALGSANEVSYFLLLSRDLRLLPPEQFAELDTRVRNCRRMLAGLIEEVARARQRMAKDG